VRLAASVLVLAWLGAGQAHAQDNPPAAPEAVSSETAGVAVDGTAAVPSEVASEPTPAASDAPDAGDAGGEGEASGSSLEEGTPDPAIDDLNRKLLGDEPVVPDTPSVRQVEEMELPETPGWIWPVGLTVLALLVGLRWQLNRTVEAPSRLRVVQRMMLGRDGNLAVVEVGESGDRRRLLVGYGGGAPRLVAELDVPDTDTEPPVQSPGTASKRWQQALKRALPGGWDAAAGPEAADPTGPDARLRPRASLIAEVLAERDTPQAASSAPDEDRSRTPTAADPSAPAGPAVVEASDTSEDDDSETYTFRGLIG
jgi:flagellar biogenesis protein FliO